MTNVLRCGYTHEDIVCFWNFVARGDKDECWPWMGPAIEALDGRGYVAFYSGPRKGSYVAARVAWEMTHGPIRRRRLCVCHRCDHPWCVNPSHLFLATQKENIHDSIQKGRFLAWQKTGVRLDGKIAHSREHKGNASGAVA